MKATYRLPKKAISLLFLTVIIVATATFPKQASTLKTTSAWHPLKPNTPSK